MGKRRGSEAKESRTPMRPSRGAALYGYGLAGLLLAGAGVAVYLFREPLQQQVIARFGLGVLLLTAWVIALVWTAAFRRRWLLRVNLWAGALGLAVLGMGVMAFFNPASGIMAEFTLDGETTLGGDVGLGIIGSAGSMGALRLVGILIVAVGLAAPPLAMYVLGSLGKLALFVYFGLVVAVKSIGKIYKTGSVPRAGRRESPRPNTWVSSAPSASEPSGFVQAVSSLDADVEERPIEVELQPVEVYPRPLVADPLRLNPGRAQEGPVRALPSTAYSAAAHSVTAVEEMPPREDLNLEQPIIVPSDPEPALSPTIGGKFNRFWHSSDDEEQVDVIDPYPEQVTQQTALAQAAPLSTAASWSLPPTEILEEIPETDVSAEDLNETAETIRRTLAEYGVEVQMGGVKPGPTVTMYGLIPGWVRRYRQVKRTDDQGRPQLDESGRQIVDRVEEKTRVKVDAILSREKDLALALKTPSIRIETPVMGKAQVGIEVPNPNPSLVSLRAVRESGPFREMRQKGDLPVALGKGSGGETMVIDLAKMPHLLIAGATGSGKSVCINTIISCLIMEKTPAELRLLLIDPKRVELTPYNGIPHLITPVVVETDEVVGLLKGMINEMLNRYRRMEDAGVRNIATYNAKMPDKMPFLVIAVDELADLMMSAAFDVEQSLCRLAQLGRATGIHLIVATQRPSVDVLTGLIKANFPSRISFGVTSQVDSRTILDTAGADKLLGRGDMLYLPIDASKPIRAQDVFISDREIESLVDFWKSTPWAAVPPIDLSPPEGGGDSSQNGAVDDKTLDVLMDKAIELAHRYNKISTSLLQRRLRIGYPRAARLIDELEEQGVIGPSDGSKSRDVIIG